MTATLIPITSEAQWLAERARDVTSTEVPALYGLSPYLTEFELWHRKRDGFVEQREPNERIRWGLRLQDAIALGVAEDRGWKVRRLDVYARDPEARLGSSFDFEAVDPDLGRGLLEVKNVDAAVFYETWIDDAAGIEAPQHIELQVQNEMQLADAPWCAIVALVGGNEARVAVRHRDREIGDHIRARVRAFWASVAAGTPPKPNYQQDAAFLCRLHGRAEQGYEITADQELENLLTRYLVLGGVYYERQAIKARIFERTSASRIVTSFGAFTCGEVAASADKEITPEMVGQRIGGRESFRQLRFIPPSKRKS